MVTEARSASSMSGQEWLAYFYVVGELLVGDCRLYWSSAELGSEVPIDRMQREQCIYFVVIAINRTGP